MPTTHYTSKVTLYKGVPFDNTYTNILSPDDILTKKTKLDELFPEKEFTDIMLCKINTTTGEGTLRLAVPNNEAEEFNYAYVENNRGKAFFAFVHGCQYINDGRTTEDNVHECVYEFNISKDVIMSHLLNKRQIIPAPIIRHTSTEHFKNAKTPESFPATNLMNYSYKGADEVIPYIEDTEELDRRYKCIVIYIDRNEYISQDINHVPTGCQIRAFNNSRDASVYFKDKLISDNAQILTIYNIPSYMLNTPTRLPIGGEDLSDSSFLKYVDISQLRMNYFTTDAKLDFPFVLKNSKCYYYPYNMLRVYSNDGTYYDCAFEDFNTSDGFPNFRVEFSPLPPVYYAVKPKNYRHSTDNPLGFKIKTTSWPVGSFSEDAYGQYLANRFDDARNGFRVATQIGSELLPTTLGAVASVVSGGNPAVVGANMLMTEFNHVYGEHLSQESAARATDSFGGVINSGDSDLANDNIKITFSHVALRPELMIQLDNYFTNYGYAQGGIIDVPDWKGRERYIYVRTGGNIFSPIYMPGELTNRGNECPNINETNKINNVFLSGTTVWNITTFDGSISKNIDNGTDTIPLPGMPEI